MRPSTLRSLRTHLFLRVFLPEIALDSADSIDLIGRFSRRPLTPVATVLNHGPSFCILRVSAGLRYSRVGCSMFVPVASSALVRALGLSPQAGVSHSHLTHSHLI